eukprot:2544759-Heterocapsa_arctica.AAC.1
MITTATRYEHSNWIGLGLAWVVKSEQQIKLESSNPASVHQLWMDTTRLTRYLTINAGTKHRTGYSPATLTLKVQSKGQTT